jgi:ribosomal protein S20
MSLTFVIKSGSITVRKHNAVAINKIKTYLKRVRIECENPNKEQQQQQQSSLQHQLFESLIELL